MEPVVEFRQDDWYPDFIGPQHRSCTKCKSAPSLARPSGVRCHFSIPGHPPVTPWGDSSPSGSPISPCSSHTSIGRLQMTLIHIDVSQPNESSKTEVDKDERTHGIMFYNLPVGAIWRAFDGTWHVDEELYNFLNVRGYMHGNDAKTYLDADSLVEAIRTSSVGDCLLLEPQEYLSLYDRLVREPDDLEPITLDYRERFRISCLLSTSNARLLALRYDDLELRRIARTKS